MSKDQKPNKKDTVENVDNLRDLQTIQDSYELIVSVIDILKSIDLVSIYPFSLIVSSLVIASSNIRQILLK